MLLLVDGTYELFRAFFGAPTQTNAEGMEVGATRVLLRSLAAMLREARRRDEGFHVAVAFDHVIESFRNELFAGYKTGEGIDAGLLAQFPLAERAARALGVVTWPMIEFEADDAIATAAARFGEERSIDEVRILSPDKDLCQCVRANRVVLWDRRKDERTDEEGVVARLGVPPRVVPDLLALVGDTADGIPGIPKWGMKSAAAVLRIFGSIEAIPTDPSKYPDGVRGKAALSASLEALRPEARLYKRLATLRTDVPLEEDLGALKWQGPDTAALASLSDELGERRPVDL